MQLSLPTAIRKAPTSSVKDLPGPRNNDICMFPARRNILIEHGFHKFGVLLNDATNVSATVSNIPLYPAENG